MKFVISFLLFSVTITYVCCSKRRDIAIISSKNNLAKNVVLVLPLKEVVTPSIELALRECEKIFKWDRWNCPSNDFLSKRNSQHFDREAAFVRALTTAALIYTITKRCSENTLSECGCMDHTRNCPEDPEYAEKLLEDVFNDMEKSSLDAQGHAMMHNSRAGRIAIRNSLATHCLCENLQKSCTEPRCWTALKNFSEVAAQIRHMYDNARLLKVHNSGTTNWSSIPKNILVFVHQSPNYCLPGSIPGWRGMEGRQCSRSKDKERSLHERRSCKHLCKECGFRVRTKTVIKYQKCNCSFIWCCEVKCDTCELTEREHYCD